MLEAVKLALRVKSKAYDAEIQDLISAAVMELEGAGVDAGALSTECLWLSSCTARPSLAGMTARTKAIITPLTAYGPP